MVHRREFEQEIMPNEIHTGLPIRVRLRTEICDFTGIVHNITNGIVQIQITTGIKTDEFRLFRLDNVATVIKIMSFPLIHRLRKAVAGETVGVKTFHRKRLSTKQNLLISILGENLKCY